MEVKEFKGTRAEDISCAIIHTHFVYNYYNSGMVLYDVTKGRQIIVPKNNREANSAVQQFVTNETSYNVQYLGLDCEWVSTRSADYHVAVIQIATRKHVILFQTCRFEIEDILPTLLSNVLKNKDYIKVGVNIEEDVRRIRLQFCDTVRNWMDLRCIAVQQRFGLGKQFLQEFQHFEGELVKLNSAADVKTKRGSFMPKLGLETLVDFFLKKKLPKSTFLQVWGRWEAFNLSEELIKYAAADAAASLDLFLHLYAADMSYKSRRNQVEDMIFKYNQPSIAHAEDFLWESLNEQSYVHKKVRGWCLEWIGTMDPELWQILPDYHGKSNQKIVGKVKIINESNSDIDNVRPLEENMSFFVGFFMLVMLLIFILGVLHVVVDKDFYRQQLEETFVVLRQKFASFLLR